MAFVDAVSLTPIDLVAREATGVGTLVAPDATNGNKFVADRSTMLRVVNTNASPLTVTVHTNYTQYGLVLPSAEFTVPATTGDVIYTGFVDLFHQNDQNEVWVEFSSVTGVTVQVINPA